MYGIKKQGSKYKLDVVQQPDNIQCGVYTAIFAFCLINKIEMSKAYQVSAKDFRRHMFYVILANSSGIKWLEEDGNDTDESDEVVIKKTTKKKKK